MAPSEAQGVNTAGVADSPAMLYTPDRRSKQHHFLRYSPLSLLDQAPPQKPLSEEEKLFMAYQREKSDWREAMDDLRKKHQELEHRKYEKKLIKKSMEGDVKRWEREANELNRSIKFQSSEIAKSNNRLKAVAALVSRKDRDIKTLDGTIGTLETELKVCEDQLREIAATEPPMPMPPGCPPKVVD